MINTKAAIAFSFVIAGLSATAALGYPEFQAAAEKSSGRTVNCAMCHNNPDGPVGQGEGQIGGLSAKEVERLNEARSALEPGKDVDSPILNEFGNSIIKTIGKAKFLELRKDPRKLSAALGEISDLDGDGIADSTEFADGTDPLSKLHGDPYKLLLANMSKYRLDLALAVVATITIVFGFMKMVKSLQAVTKEQPDLH
jgi:cytochrome c553